MHIFMQFHYVLILESATNLQEREDGPRGGKKGEKFVKAGGKREKMESFKEIIFQE